MSSDSSSSEAITNCSVRSFGTGAGLFAVNNELPRGKDKPCVRVLDGSCDNEALFNAKRVFSEESAVSAIDSGSSSKGDALCATADPYGSLEAIACVAFGAFLLLV